MWQPFSSIIVVAVMVIVVVCILTEKVNRAAISLVGALVCFFVMVFGEGKQFKDIVGYLVGTEGENYSSIHALILIAGMMLIVQVASQSGLFQFLAFNIIKMTGKSSFRLMVTINLLGILITAIMNNILSVMILVPLIVMICRILDLDAKPFIITMGIGVNLGAALFSVSAIENILISAYVPFTFGEFFLMNGLTIIALIFPTMAFFYFFYRKSWKKIETGIEILKEFDTWTFIPNKALMYKALVTLVGVMVCFVIVPPDVMPPDIIALVGAVALVIASRLDAREIFSKFDTELVFYLLGIFVISGAMYDIGILEQVALGLNALSGGSVLASTLLMLWISGYLAGVSNPTAIARIMMPVIKHMGLGSGSRYLYSSLAFSCVLGDNLTAMGDNMVVVSLSKQNNRPVTPKEITMLGFATVQFQFALLSIYYCFCIDPATNWPIGLLLIIIFAGAIASFILIRYLLHMMSKKGGRRVAKKMFKSDDKDKKPESLTDYDYNE
jgi:Na+/H+ antiporter NhaD/arsenite permease-like protein